MNRDLSLSQRIWNCAATQEAEFVHATHTYLHARANATEEWSQIWSQNDDVSWAHAFGRMRGFKSVWNGSVTLYDVKATQRFQGAYEAMPEIGGFDIRPLMELSLHTLATDIIEVADDGKTARAFFLTPGLISGAVGDNGKRRCSGLWERYGADFIFEDGCWLFLHEQVCPDMGIGCDAGNPGMENYLPQTLKILENYAKLEEQDVDGENIRETKQKIEGMMDKIVDGYEAQLDKLFEDDALDISADLKVMESMLEKDGLTADNELRL